MKETPKHETGETLPDKVAQMIRQQKESWPVARQNFAGLKKAGIKSVAFDGFEIITQFNPERIRSSAAKTDARTLRERACFLCAENRDEKQQGIDFKRKYTILINPFPIFPEHLTIPLNEHKPQEIEPYFPDLLELSRLLPRFTIFYNGPKCGASAPDHFHFQAGNKNMMPVDREINAFAGKQGEILFKNGETTLTAVGKSYLRKLLLLVSSSEENLVLHFQNILNILKERGQEGEPMMNILGSWEKGQWRILLFPRDRQRPEQFYAGGKEQILISPASVELGGLAILPRKEDFDKLTKQDLVAIYKQVTINDADFEQLKKKIKETTGHQIG